MPYQHCPSCNLAVNAPAEEVEGGPCPRCGAPLTALRPSRRTSSLSALDPGAVRALLAKRGGRFRRGQTSSPGRPSARSRAAGPPPAAA